MSHSTGGFCSGRPVSSRDRIDCEVESESVHVHLGDPVAEAVLDHPTDDGLIGVEGVAAPAEVRVSRLVLREDVIELVGQPSITERRPVLAAFGRVVEHDIEDHFDTGAVQRLDHVAELVQHAERIRARAVPWCGAKKDSGWYPQ